MKKLLSFIVVFSLVATIYVTIVDPILYSHFIDNNYDYLTSIDKGDFSNDNNLNAGNGLKEDETNKNNSSNSNGNSGGTTTNNDGNNTSPTGGSSNNDNSATTGGSGTVTPGNGTTTGGSSSEAETGSNETKKDIDFVYYTQDKSVTGLTGACLLTSFAMVITNAGRIVGTKKEYGPIDVYLANNPDATSEGDRVVLAWYYRISAGFNYTWWRNKSDSFVNLSNSDKEAYVKNLLKDNPWGVIIGGVYGTNGTHYIVARLDNDGKLVFDDPVKSRGPNLSSLSKAYGINSWDKITSVMTVTPNLDSKGVWKDGVYDKCKKNPSNCHVCSTKVDCD